MRHVKWLAPGAALLVCAGVAGAADFADPTWPCIQRKVEELSIGLIWPTPPAGMDLAPETEKAVAELAETLALRRVDLDAARTAVQDFAEAHGHDAALMGEVFARVFKSLSTRRTQIIRGIGKFSLNQITLSDRIDKARSEMETLTAATEPDFDRIDALEAQLDWDQRIFNDRQKTITYLCETPTLLEKRLYAIAQILQTAGNGGG